MSYHLLVFYKSLMLSWGADRHYAPISATILASLTIILGAILLYLILSKPVAQFINHRIKSTTTLLDDFIFTERVIHTICIAIVTLICASILPPVFRYFPSVSIYVDKGCSIINIGVISWVITAIARGACEYINYTESNTGGSMVLRNLINSVVWCIAALLCISIILDKDIAYVVSGLGAMAAVLMLVFRDSILGMTAGIRLTANKMLKVNDWVSVPKYGAEGRVEDLTLSAVKIRNWDQSVSSVPPYALITDGFTNHEAMLEQGIRQIKRTFNIDVNSIRRMSKDEITRLAETEWLPAEVRERKTDAVNLTLFRKWLKHKIETFPRLSPEPRYFIKEHPHSSSGIPIEIHLFVFCTEWAEFEELQADFLDDIIATVHTFGLRLYQSPSGYEISSLATKEK